MPPTQFTRLGWESYAMVQALIGIGLVCIPVFIIIYIVARLTLTE